MHVPVFVGSILSTSHRAHAAGGVPGGVFLMSVIETLGRLVALTWPITACPDDLVSPEPDPQASRRMLPNFLRPLWRLICIKCVLRPLGLVIGALFGPYRQKLHDNDFKIPIVGGPSLRALVFNPPNYDPTRVNPLHINFHGGGFVDGYPDDDGEFCRYLCEQCQIHRLGVIDLSLRARVSFSNTSSRRTCGVEIHDEKVLCHFVDSHQRRRLPSTRQLLSIQHFFVGIV
jgi:hypothetical protein